MLQVARNKEDSFRFVKEAADFVLDIQRTLGQNARKGKLRYMRIFDKTAETVLFDL